MCSMLNSFHCLPCPSFCRCAVIDDLGQRTAVDVVEQAEDIDVSRCAKMRPNEGRVALQRCFIVLNTDAPAVVEPADVGLMLVPEGFDDAVRGKRRRAALGVVDDNDVLQAEQVLGDSDGSQSVDSASAGNDDGKRVVVDATRLPFSSTITRPGYSSSP